jgi:exonuclease SbcC
VTARAAASDAQREQEALVAGLERLFRDAGVDLSARPPRDTVVDALADARRVRDLAVETRRQLEERTAQRDGLEADRQVADLLGRLLRSDGFIAWLLDEALDALVEGATRRLARLSRDRYSLAVDEKGAFLVIDHSNADEARLARTLSGGETFLASLSLALALADQVSQLTAAGAPKLESIILDEGFGALDPDTLDVVVGAIEELQAAGRMVGLVSHVPEIAERVPVRFEVTRGPTTSTVERVEV